MFETTAAIKAYLLREFLPFWYEKGFDPSTGFFHAALDQAGRPSGSGKRRLLVQCRQIYVFSHGRLLGAPDWCLDAALRGLERLEASFWDGREGGWLRTLDSQGNISDGRKDTYDHAFVLFAMAYLHRAAGGDRPLELASRTLDLLEDRLADPLLGGFMEGAERDWTLLAEPRRQNPHMHLFEAFLAMHEASGEERYLSHAHRIFDLFKRHFFDRVHGCLGEHFDRDWRRHPSELGEVIEPGHHFEWVWLLRQYARVAESEEALEFADRLFDFGFKAGLDPVHGGAFDRVSREGRILGDGKRVWPQTEYLKACAVRLEAGIQGAGDQLRSGLDLCARRHASPKGGYWKELFDREGKVLADPVSPATSAYHIFLGLSEAARVLEKIKP